MKTIDSLKYFVKRNDRSVVYVTYIPNGCKNGNSYAKQDNTISKIKKYFNENIKTIGVRNEIGLV